MPSVGSSALLIAPMSVVLPDPQPPKIRIAKLGWLSAMIPLNAMAMSLYPSAGSLVGASSKIFFPTTTLAFPGLYCTQQASSWTAHGEHHRQAVSGHSPVLPKNPDRVDP